MFMLWLYRYITGYVVFMGTGRFPERFLNLCAKNGITVWDSYFAEYKLFGKMKVKDYKRIIKIARKARVKLRIQKKVGCVFILHRYRARIGIPIGAVAFFAIILYMTSFVWQIDVAGNEKVSSEKILSQLCEIGVFEGQSKRKIDTEYMRQQLLINDKRLSWAAINIKGCFATIDVRETKNKNQKETDAPPSNIVAAKGGTIVSIKAYSGKISVKTGEAVAEGDLLVSGAVELKNGTTRFVESNAQVIAQTERKIATFVPFEQINTTVSSKYTKRTVLGVFGANIPLFSGSVDYKCKTEKIVSLPNINGVEIPISLTSKKFYAITETKYRINEQQAKEKALDLQAEKCKKELKNIMKKRISTEYVSNKKGISCVCKYLCEENIAKSENILINSVTN